MSRWQELSVSVEDRLTAASSGERGVFAAGVAERLMGWHAELPEEERAPYTMSLRPLLDSVWEAVLGDSTAFGEVKRGVGEYLLSDYCHNDGPDGPDDADDPAAAATLYAAQAYLLGCGDFAHWTSDRALEAVDDRFNRLADDEADDEGDDEGDDGDRMGQDTEAPDPDDALVAELQRQLRDLDLIATHAEDLRHADLGLSIDTSARLRATLRGRLAERD